ncbi:MAG TPA: D-glycero-beta-D-manno-heptose-7-phosphate kinase [bacterium]|jgi:rfaE bifunctional protein kinase chain/domain|nr:D-glycero-beta-D-manno-heptose-7-phosphate kinase [bacterium]
MDNALLRGWVPRLAGKRVLVIGDVMADHYVWGRVERISPEAPIPVVHVSREEVKPGGAANVANNIMALGGRVSLAGIVGADSMASTLRSLLGAKGISTDGLIEDPGRPTIAKTRVIAQSQQVVRVDRELRGPLEADIQDAFLKSCLRQVEDCDAVLFSDYAKGALSAGLAAAVTRRARELGKVVAADPKPANVDWFHGVGIVTPNQGEASAASGVAIRNDASAQAAAQVLMERLSSEAVLVTRGEHGMTLVQAKGGVTHIPTRAREVFDVTGAGDTVIATLTLALAAGMPVPEACALANAAAGLVVAEIGVAVVSPAQLERALA